MKYNLALDLGGTNVRTALVDERGNLSHLKATSSKAQARALEIENNIKELLVTYTNYEKLILALPGPLDYERKLMRMATNIPALQGYPLAANLSVYLNKEVLVEKDSSCAAFAEALLGSGRNYESIYYITHSTGIGGCFIENKKILRGHCGFAGEIGGIIIDRQREKVNHLNIGAIENEASGLNLERKSAKPASDLFNSDDINDKQIIETMAYDLAQLLATIALVLDPACFVWGGGVARHASAKYFPMMLKHFRDLAQPCQKDIPVILSTLAEPGLVGAGLLGFN